MSIIATLERMFWFDDQVRRGRYPNAATLADKFELSQKTAQRCIDAMRDRFGAPLEYAPARRGYHYALTSFQLPHFRIQQEEVLALLLAKNLFSASAGGFISRHLETISRKLAIETGGGATDVAAVDRCFSASWTGNTPAHAEDFHLVSRALISSRQLSMGYNSPGAATVTRRTVEPHHLQHHMGSWILTAWCHLRREWRKFYIARMSDIAVLDTTFAPRPEQAWRPLVNSAFGLFQSRETVTVTLRFTPFRSRWIREQHWHPDQKMVLLENGAVDLHLPVADFREIKMKILQFGADVTVLSPDALKAELADEIEKMRALYPDAAKVGGLSETRRQG